jgi:hypothetical protein
MLNKAAREVSLGKEPEVAYTDPYVEHVITEAYDELVDIQHEKGCSFEDDFIRGVVGEMVEYRERWHKAK